MTISFLSVLGSCTPLLDRNKALLEIVLKDMKGLVLQVMAVVMVYVDICAEGNVPVYCNKAMGIKMQNHAGVILVHTVI